MVVEKSSIGMGRHWGRSVPRGEWWLQAVYAKVRAQKGPT